MYPAWLTRALTQLTITNVGFYATLSLLTVYFVEQLGFNGSQIAFVMLFSILGLRVSRFALAPFLNRLSPRTLIHSAVLTSATGYVALAFAATPIAVALSLLVIGTGYGCNGLAVTTLSSHSPDDKRRGVYALQYTLGHSASALGPLIAGLIADDLGHRTVFLFSASLVALSGFAILKLKCEVWEPQRAGFYRLAATLIRRPTLLRLFATTAMGWFLYTQKYACLPLLIIATGGSAKQIGSALLLFSLTIIFTSLPLSRCLKKYEVIEAHAISASFFLYGAGSLVIASAPGVLGLTIGIIFWAIAEALLMPSLNTAISHASDSKERLAAFSLSALFVALGEWCGMAGGTALFRHFEALLKPDNSFYTLSAIAFTFLIFHLLIHVRKKFYAP